MDRDIVYDESELSIAANQLMNYAEFLGLCIDEYTAILKELKTKGIKDDKVCACIDELINTIAIYKSSMYNEGENLKNLVNKTVKEVIDADKFTFSSEVMASIRTTLTKFLV